MTSGLRRRAGLLIPLFSFPSATSWGIGDIGDIAPMAAWFAGSGHRVLQLLPLNEMAPGEQSPYSALSAMAIDPIYISLPGVPDFEAIGGESSLDGVDRSSLDAARATPVVDYSTVRRIKQRALAASFERFYETAWRLESSRAAAFKEFVAAEAWWIDDYALYRAIHARENDRPWTVWPEPLRDRDPDALRRVREELSREVLQFQYLQWLADLQWREARAVAASHGIAIFGDLPFMVNEDSADVWTRASQFRLDVSVGAPPDAFSADGQNWGVPMYRWDAMADDGFEWLRERARRSASLYDGYRVDHLVGFYRTYGRPRDGGPPFFSPAEEPDQLKLGETVLGILAGTGSEIIAEDLGTVPDYVRASLARLGIPGFRVLRWERHWRTPGQPFRDPAEYPEVSVATSGTHDTEPLVTWWDHAPIEDQRKVGEVPTIQRLTGGRELTGAPYDRVRDTLLEALFASGSNLVLNVFQDVFGWRDRINEPATVNEVNWTFRLPWPSDRLADVPAARQHQATLRAWTERYAR